MRPQGIVLAIIGVWLITQTVRGDLLGLLGLGNGEQGSTQIPKGAPGTGGGAGGGAGGPW